ncbi:MAG TPA: hypothetical protein VFK80_08480 [Limnochordia bacterium]|nr:hypothetical protein [Limnochordia bacterium]
MKRTGGKMAEQERPEEHEPIDQSAPDAAERDGAAGPSGRDEEARRRRGAWIGLIGSALLAVFSAGYVWLHTQAAPAAKPQSADRVVVWADLNDAQLAALRTAGDAFARQARVRVDLQPIGDLPDTLPKALFAHVAPDVVLGGSRYLEHLLRTGVLAELPAPNVAGAPSRIRLLAGSAQLWEEPLGLAVIGRNDDPERSRLAAKYVNYVADRLTAPEAAAASSTSIINRQSW